MQSALEQINSVPGVLGSFIAGAGEVQAAALPVFLSSDSLGQVTEPMLKALAAARELSLEVRGATLTFGDTQVLVSSWAAAALIFVVCQDVADLELVHDRVAAVRAGLHPEAPKKVATPLTESEIGWFFGGSSGKSEPAGAARISATSRTMTSFGPYPDTVEAAEGDIDSSSAQAGSAGERARETAARGAVRETAAQGAARETAAQGAAREQAAREQAARDTAVRDAAAREAAARDTAAREAAAREVAARQQAARDTAARGAGAREQAARDAVVREAAAREDVAKEAAARALSAKPPAAGEASGKQAAAQEPASREPATREAASRDLGSRDVPRDAREAATGAAIGGASSPSAAPAFSGSSPPAPLPPPGPPTLTPEIRTRIQVELAKHVGPVASLLVNEIARPGMTVAAVVDLLAREIDMEGDRASFLAAVSALAR